MFELSIFLAIAAAILGLMRTHSVSNYRHKLIKFYSSSVGEGLDRFHWYDSLPDFNQMMIRFWKPLDSFVAGKYADEFLYGGLDL